jgi:hypothetical protein
MLNELRLGWMKVSGGTAQPNSGNHFAQDVGLSASRPIPATWAFRRSRPAAATARFGDPTIFTTRDNSTSSCSTTSRSIAGAHRLKFGAYYFHLQLRPEQPDNARGAFTYTGQFSGNAFADFLLGYPDVGGIGHRPRRRERPDQLAATCTRRTTGRRAATSRSTWACATSTTSICTRRQPVVVGRSVDSRRPIRHRER